jgi:hypothetical protein
VHHFLHLLALNRATIAKLERSGAKATREGLPEPPQLGFEDGTVRAAGAPPKGLFVDRKTACHQTTLALAYCLESALSQLFRFTEPFLSKPSTTARAAK